MVEVLSGADYTIVAFAAGETGGGVIEAHPDKGVRTMAGITLLAATDGNMCRQRIDTDADGVIMTVCTDRRRIINRKVVIKDPGGECTRGMAVATVQRGGHVVVVYENPSSTITAWRWRMTAIAGC